MLGKHRHYAVNEIDRRGAALGLLVDDRVGSDVVGDVGDMHSHAPVAVGQPADGEGVVEVLGVLGVDGEGGLLAISSGVIPASILSAAFSTASGYL